MRGREGIGQTAEIRYFARGAVFPVPESRALLVRHENGRPLNGECSGQDFVDSGFRIAARSVEARGFEGRGHEAFEDGISGEVGARFLLEGVEDAAPCEVAEKNLGVFVSAEAADRKVFFPFEGARAADDRSEGRHLSSVIGSGKETVAPVQVPAAAVVVIGVGEADVVGKAVAGDGLLEEGRESRINERIGIGLLEEVVEKLLLVIEEGLFFSFAQAFVRLENVGNVDVARKIEIGLLEEGGKIHERPDFPCNSRLSVPEEDAFGIAHERFLEPVFLRKGPGQNGIDRLVGVVVLDIVIARGLEDLGHKAFEDRVSHKVASGRLLEGVEDLARGQASKQRLGIRLLVEGLDREVRFAFKPASPADDGSKIAHFLAVIGFGEKAVFVGRVPPPAIVIVGILETRAIGELDGLDRVAEEVCEAGVNQPALVGRLEEGAKIGFPFVEKRGFRPLGEKVVETEVA